MPNDHKPAIEPDPHIVALFVNARRSTELRELGSIHEPTERAAEICEWLCSEAWARLVALVRSEQWELLLATLDEIDRAGAEDALRWAAIELARLEP